MSAVTAAEPPARVGSEAESLAAQVTMDSFLRDVEARAYRIALVGIRDADDALDVVQEAMIRLVRRYGDRPSCEWRPLFYRILRNRMHDWQRRRAVRAGVMRLFGGQGDGGVPADAMAPSAGSPHAQAVAGDAMQALEAALRGLPARQREAFMLRNFEGLDVAETAGAMRCSSGSVKTHYSRAVQRLRELLGDHWQ